MVSSSKFFKEIRFLERTSSTQDEVLSLPVPSFVFSRTQSSGRGRFQRKWFSPEGGVWFSFSVDVFHPADSPLLALPIVDFLVGSGLKAKVKLPNDVLVKGKKIAGILVERRDFFVIGVGMNYFNDVPPEISHRAVSLKDLLELRCKEDLSLPHELALELAEKMMTVINKIEIDPEFEKVAFERLSEFVLKGTYSTRFGQVNIVGMDGKKVVFLKEGRVYKAKVNELF